MKTGETYKTDAYGVVKLVREASGGWFVTTGGSEPFYVTSARLKQRVVKTRKAKVMTEVIRTDVADASRR